MTRKPVAIIVGVLALILGSAPLLRAATWPPLNRPGFVSVRLDPHLPSSFLPGTSHMPILDRFFAGEAERFGHGLADMLGTTVFSKPVFVLPGNVAEAHQAFREQGEPDSFLLTIDLIPSYGLQGDGFAGTCLNMLTFLLLSTVDMFTYSVHLQAQVDVFYIAPDGTRISLTSNLYRLEASTRGDFFQVMDMRQEVEWITDLTRATQEEAQRLVTAELPAKILERAWRQAGERMRSAPMVARKRADLLKPSQLPADDTPAAGSATGIEEMVRQVSRSVCRVGAARGTGSGFIVSPRGFVVTSLGALGGERTATVQFHQGEELPADLIFADPRYDLAVLSIPFGDYAALVLGSSAVRPDDALLVFGFAGRDGLSIVSGQVADSANDPRLTTGTPLPAESTGGPVLNRRGEVIGMAMLQAESGARLLPIGLVRQSIGALADSRLPSAAAAGEAAQVSYTAGIPTAWPVASRPQAAQ